MRTFNDLVADLTRENLLDDSSLLPSSKANKEFKSRSGPELPDQPFPDLLTISENYELKLPEFSVLKPEDEIGLEDGQFKNVFPTNDSNLTFQNTQNLIRYQTRRPRPKRPGKMKRYCRSCATNLPLLSLHCRFCDRRVVSDLYYYSVILFGFVIFAMTILVFITNKTYK